MLMDPELVYEKPCVLVRLKSRLNTPKAQTSLLLLFTSLVIPRIQRLSCSPSIVMLTLTDSLLSADDICDTQSFKGDSKKHQPMSHPYAMEPTTYGPHLNVDTTTTIRGKIIFFNDGSFGEAS